MAAYLCLLLHSRWGEQRGEESWLCWSCCWPKQETILNNLQIHYIKEEYNYRNTFVEMRDTLLTYKNIICQKILTVRLEDGKMSNKDTQQLSQNLFIGFLCLKCPTLREKVYWICLIYVIYVLYSAFYFDQSSTYLPQLCRRRFSVFVWMMFFLLL